MLHAYISNFSTLISKNYLFIKRQLFVPETL